MPCHTRNAQDHSPLHALLRASLRLRAAPRAALQALMPQHMYYPAHPIHHRPAIEHSPPTLKLDRRARPMCAGILEATTVTARGDERESVTAMGNGTTT